MSYFMHDSREARHLVDKLPVYVFPAFVGSGRILLGMALAGVTTAILLHTHAAGDSVFWWLGLFAYMASVVLTVSGIFAVNYIPPQHSDLHHGRPSAATHPPSRPVLPLVDQPTPSPVSGGAGESVQGTPRGVRSHLGDLLVDSWKLITDEQLRRAQTRQSNSDRSLVHELARMNLLTDKDLEHILEVQAADADPWHNASRG